MGEHEKTPPGIDEAGVAEIKRRMCDLVDDLARDDDAAVADFDALLNRAGDLWRRKQNMEGTKSDTRDLIAEVIFARLHRAFRKFYEGGDAAQITCSAEWVMGMLYSGAALTDLARAFDTKMLETQSRQDFSFAGQTNFISLQEVLQLLSGGGYDGMLALEKADNRLDLYIQKGKVRLFDPHRLIRRILPNHDGVSHREIPVDLIQKAEEVRKSQGVPLVLALKGLGFLRESELRDQLQNLGLEIFHEFLCDTAECTFFYRKLDTMPAFVDRYGEWMHVTPILLEGSKRMDEWSVLKDVFPDPDAPIEAPPDMFARMEGLNLGVLEIKLLAAVNRGSSARQISTSIGLPLFDVYQHLVRYARDGIVIPVGGLAALADITFTLEETMEKAFEMLDQNDDTLATERALDDVLGDPLGGVPEPGAGGDSFLDILAAKDGK